MMKVLILYYSKSGHTLEAANATAEGIRSAGSEADIVAVTDFDASLIAKYDGLIVGSPCWAGSVTGAGIANPIKQAIKPLAIDALEQRRCGGISVYAITGGNNTVRAIGKQLIKKGCSNYMPGPSAKAGVPLSTVKGPSVTTKDEEIFKAYGAKFVK